MPSHKELLQAKVAEAERNHQRASQEQNRLHGEVAATNAKIAACQERYDKACLESAKGNSKAEDPATILAERDRHGHHLRGLEQAHKAASDAAQATSAALVECSNLLQQHLETEELQRLEAAIVEARAHRDSAQGHLNDAEKALHGATWTLSRFRRQLDLKARGKA